MKSLLRLLVFLRKYWAWLTLGFICLLATTGFGLAVPWFIRQVIDNIISRGDRGFLMIAAVAVVGASALRGIFAFGQHYLGEVTSQKTVYDIRNAIYDQLQRLSFAYHDQTQTGQLMSRATVDVEAVRQFLGRGLLGMGRFTVMFIGIACILISMNWQLALFSMLFLVAIGFRAVNVGRALRPIWLRVQQLMGTLGTTLEENLIGVRIVKSFSRQPDESRKFSADARLLYDEQIKAARQIAFNIPLMTFLITLPIVIVLWYGGRQVIAGNLTMGELSQFILYLGMMAMPIRQLGMLTNNISRAMSASQRIMEVLDTRSPVQEKPGAIELESVDGQVSFSEVSFGYDSSSPVLKELSFRAQPGELVALVGSLGSGKSTIAQLIPRFYDVTSGSVTVDGHDVRDVTVSSLRRNVGIVQQDIFLFAATIRDNIAYGAVNADMERIEEVAKAASLHDFILSLPDGYETQVGERGITLSGGEKQRLAIARTLLMNPGILILDDSMSSVDTKTEKLIRGALDKLIRGRTTFIITHRLSIIQNADIILVMDDGQVIERGKHGELMAKQGLYHQIYETQLSAAEVSAESPAKE
ncbi:ABC transporter ATP-binding protein [Chloroflexota bacterium]